MTSGQGATVLGCAGPVLAPDEAAFFREADPFGFILFARNVENPDQLRRLTDDLRAAVGRDALITVDQEGGRVQRMRAPHWREWLPPLEQAEQIAASAGPEAATRSLWIVARIIAAELRGAGIDSNCAPCADIAGPDTHPFLRNRCLGTDPATVTRNARTVAEGLLAGGVVPVMKHLPGHGRATVDSHLGLPVADVTLAAAATWDFAPFRALADLPMGMTAHIVLPELGDLPATQNPAAIRLIRESIGFDGLLLTDDLNMSALAGDLRTRAACAIAAGCDIALHCSGKRPEMEAVVAAAGHLAGEAARRATAALAARRDPDPVDIAALEAELADLLTGKAHV
ncbi:glycoside hydrolase family 3 protein [Szabonella alba]|uniref:beta-N-acetylhexosaminidase n=1 Tax=Szabonella alba TaxID=2804194 RepID=A0A8K0VDP3_9RHOB|nr:glycoside hydrolase family 3 protein [Szabonella alba]MBL4917804.1 glycoside hydrolase family 3 protein [Szabonella alba]